MARDITFYKLQASGNDFILIDGRVKKRCPPGGYKKFAVQYCRPKFGIGADGVLVIESSRRQDFKMRIFNADGTEAEMCGNGARCAGLWAHRVVKREREVSFDTVAGVIEAIVKRKGEVKIKMTDPCDCRLGVAIDVLGRGVTVHYIETGVPHVIVFVHGLEDIDVTVIGRAIRSHPSFKPRGANVDFVQIQGKDSIALRTYERGVEAETLSCGTGVVAAAIITKANAKELRRHNRINVLTKSGEALAVQFDSEGGKITNVWVEGKACLVYKGQIEIGGRYA